MGRRTYGKEKVWGEEGMGRRAYGKEKVWGKKEEKAWGGGGGMGEEGMGRRRRYGGKKAWGGGRRCGSVFVSTAWLVPKHVCP